MSEPIKEQIEPQDTPGDVARRTAEGRDQATPFFVLGGVTLTVAVVAGILITALVILWWVLAR